MDDIYRIKLEPITEDDLEYIRLLRNKFKDAFFYKREITKDQQAIWWDKYLAKSREAYTFYVVRLKSTNERIGTTSLTRVKEGVYEFGNNILDTSYQGKGYFREVYQTVLGILGDNTLMARVDESNEHMQDVYRKFRLFEFTEEDRIVFSNRWQT